ncbi:MAG: hypothetical protein ACRERD_34175, partial [Candidatus Binatia bacterium]
AIPILQPPLNLQNQYASIVLKIEDLRAKLLSDLARVNNLFNSLQQRAFSGELFTEKAVSVSPFAGVNQHV